MSEDIQVQVAVLQSEFHNLDKKFDKLSKVVEGHMEQEELDRKALERKLNTVILVGVALAATAGGDTILRLLGLLV